MGTNYYLYENVCPYCNKEDNVRHIGKFTKNSPFKLHIEEGVKSLDDWMKLLSKKENVIENEYGEIISFKEMKKIIMVDSNYGSGTWKLVKGEFS